MKIISFFLYLIIIFSSQSILADETIVIGGLDGQNPHVQENKFRVLLALSGGGARGMTIIGVLKAFEEKNIEVVGIAGTSMGGIIGGLYASGYTPLEIEEFANELNFNTLFANSPPRNSMFLTKREENEQHLLSIRFDKFKPVLPKALTSGQKLTSLLTRQTTKALYKCDADFSKLPIPFLTVSTDIVSGEQVILQNGSIAEAMRATMAFPLAFTGIEIDGRILMDGGMVNPIPVDLARTLTTKSQFVVAINTSSKLAKKDEIITPIDIANQVTSIMMADKLQEQLEKADYVICPPIDDYHNAQFEKKDTLIAIGYYEGIKAADKIIAMLAEAQSISFCEIYNIDSKSLTTSELNKIQKLLFHKKLTLEKLTKILKQFSLKNNFFKLTATLHDMNSDSSQVALKAISIDGFKNFQAKKFKLQFSGNTIFRDLELANLFTIENTPITPKIIQNGLEKILELYQTHDYDLVNIESVSIDSSDATLMVQIDEAIIKSINILDNTTTKDWFVRSYFPLKKNESYSTELASEGIRNIYGTDLFERVTVDALPSDDGVVVRIRVKEKHSKRLRFGWHWDDEFDSEEFIELLNDNFAGIGLEYKLHARYAPNRQNFYFSFKADRIFKTYLTSQFKIFHTRYLRQLYNFEDRPLGYHDEKTTGFQIGIGQQIERLGTVSATLSIKERDVFDSETSTTTTFGLRKLKFESLFENFDQLPFTRSGNKHIFRLEFVGKFVGGDIEYTKFYTSHETYIPISKSFTYHPHLALGASRSGLPISEQFYLGGLNSFTGFRKDQLSGDKMFIFSNEIRLNLPLNIYFTARYDLGEVYNSTDQIKLRNLRNAVGASLSLDSPIGPFTFGYGIVNQDLENVYLHIGFKF